MNGQPCINKTGPIFGLIFCCLQVQKTWHGPQHKSSVFAKWPLPANRRCRPTTPRPSHRRHCAEGGLTARPAIMRWPQPHQKFSSVTSTSAPARSRPTSSKTRCPLAALPLIMADILDTLTRSWLRRKGFTGPYRHSSFRFVSYLPPKYLCLLLAATRTKRVQTNPPLPTPSPASHWVRMTKTRQTSMERMMMKTT